MNRLKGKHVKGELSKGVSQNEFIDCFFTISNIKIYSHAKCTVWEVHFFLIEVTKPPTEPRQFHE